MPPGKRGNAMDTDLERQLYRHPDLVAAACAWGYGVFTTGPIPADTTLEECRHLPMPWSECSGAVVDYVFGLEPEEGAGDGESAWVTLPLGWGCLYNHSDTPNAGYWHDTDRDLIVFHTIRAVSAGEQLFVDYGREWWETRDRTPAPPTP